MAYAYNRGAHEGVRRAIGQNLMPHCEMVWSTAGTHRVCGRCLELKDKTIGTTAETGVILPPLHPRCRCAIIYREVKGEESKKPTQSKPSSLEPTAQNPIKIKELGARHYGVIQVILANAPNPKAAQVWSKFEGEIKIASINYKDTMIHKNGLLYLDMTEVAAGDIINKPYQILFHECIHGIDYLHRRGGKYFSEHYKGGALLKAIKADFEALISAQKSKLETKSEKEALESLCLEWKKYPRICRAPLSDLLSAQTDNKYNLGIGHSVKYWQQGGEAIKFREGLADFAEAALANKPAYELLKQKLPKANAVFEEMLEELLRGDTHGRA